MKIDLTDVLSEQHRPIEKDVSLDMVQFIRESETFPIAEKENVHILIESIKEQKLLITGNTKLVIVIPCDRCLTGVNHTFDLEFHKEVDLSEEVNEVDEDLDENNFIDGKDLDVDQLICNEILIDWPMKVLCREDCPGIVYEKEESLDPRMAAALDVFKNFKTE